MYIRLRQLLRRRRGLNNGSAIKARTREIRRSAITTWINRAEIGQGNYGIRTLSDFLNFARRQVGGIPTLSIAHQDLT